MSRNLKSNFSIELKKYYSRRGNRVLFTNGMTLNQLGWEMWERLGYQEIDPSVLSRVLNSERAFSPQQLLVFCNILRIDKEGVNKLYNLFFFEQCKKCDLIPFIEIHYNKVIVDFIFALTNKIAKYNESGKSEQYYELREMIIDLIQSFLPLQIKYKNTLMRQLTRIKVILDKKQEYSEHNTNST